MSLATIRRVSSALAEIQKRIRDWRERRGLSTEDLEARLLLGPGWMTRFEVGASVPSLDFLLTILHELGADPHEFFAGLRLDGVRRDTARALRAVQDGADLVLHFPYAKHDARYRLPRADLAQFEDVVRTLRDRLSTDPSADDAAAVKADAVATSFLAAARVWPHANPSDLWWFLVYRAYCDRFSHPARDARLDLGQSWKRTAGWALEEILIRFYGPFLNEKGIRIFIAGAEEKQRLVDQFEVADRLEADKVDVLLTGSIGGVEHCFGVVHVKASFAERRTDDVPMSKALVAAGYTSPLWTFDCKSTPDALPFNKGELGVVRGVESDRRSAKRKDIEDDGYFSACFSYNSNTRPTPAPQACAARIFVENFASPDDQFSHFILSEWERWSSGRE